MTDAEFRECDFTEVSLADTTLKRFSAADCRFVRCSFFKTMLTGIDFSNNTFSSPIVSSPPVELKGCTVSLTQAAGLAGLLGVKVRL